MPGFVPGGSVSLFPSWHSGLQKHLRDSEELYAVKINWDYLDKEIADALALRTLNQRPSAPTKGKGGKGATLPFERFKWLAAWRLNAAGYDHITAKTLADNRRISQRSEAPSNI